MIARAAILAVAALWSTLALPLEVPPPDVIETQLLVQARVKYVAEPAGADVWHEAVDSGDCEDFSLAKRAELMRRGYAAERLQILFAHSNTGAGHAALLVDGKWVLDNNWEFVLPMVLWTRHFRVACVIQDISTESEKKAADRC